MPYSQLVINAQTGDIQHITSAEDYNKLGSEWKQTSPSIDQLKEAGMMNPNTGQYDKWSGTALSVAEKNVEKALGNQARDLSPEDAAGFVKTFGEDATRNVLGRRLEGGQEAANQFITSANNVIKLEPFKTTQDGKTTYNLQAAVDGGVPREVIDQAFGDGTYNNAQDEISFPTYSYLPAGVDPESPNAERSRITIHSSAQKAGHAPTLAQLKKEEQATARLIDAGAAFENDDGRIYLDSTEAIKVGASKDDVDLVFGAGTYAKAKGSDQVSGYNQFMGDQTRTTKAEPPSLQERIVKGFEAKHVQDPKTEFWYSKDWSDAIRDPGLKWKAEKQFELGGMAAVEELYTAIREPYQMDGGFDVTRMIDRQISEGRTDKQIVGYLQDLGFDGDEVTASTKYMRATPKERFTILQSDGTIPKDAMYTGEQDGEPTYIVPKSKADRLRYMALEDVEAKFLQDTSNRAAHRGEILGNIADVVMRKSTGDRYGDEVVAELAALYDDMHKLGARGDERRFTIEKYSQLSDASQKALLDRYRQREAAREAKVILDYVPIVSTARLARERGWKSGWTIASLVGDIAILAPPVARMATKAANPTLYKTNALAAAMKHEYKLFQAEIGGALSKPTRTAIVKLNSLTVQLAKAEGRAQQIQQRIEKLADTRFKFSKAKPTKANLERVARIDREMDAITDSKLIKAQQAADSIAVKVDEQYLKAANLLTSEKQTELTQGLLRKEFERQGLGVSRDIRTSVRLFLRDVKAAKPASVNKLQKRVVALNKKIHTERAKDPSANVSEWIEELEDVTRKLRELTPTGNLQAMEKQLEKAKKELAKARKKYGVESPDAFVLETKVEKLSGDLLDELRAYLRPDIPIGGSGGQPVPVGGRPIQPGGSGGRPKAPMYTHANPIPRDIKGNLLYDPRFWPDLMVPLAKPVPTHVHLIYEDPPAEDSTAFAPVIPMTPPATPLLPTIDPFTVPPVLPVTPTPGRRIRIVTLEVPELSLTSSQASVAYQFPVEWPATAGGKTKASLKPLTVTVKELSPEQQTALQANPQLLTKAAQQTSQKVKAIPDSELKTITKTELETMVSAELMTNLQTAINTQVQIKPQTDTKPSEKTATKTTTATEKVSALGGIVMTPKALAAPNDIEIESVQGVPDNPGSVLWDQGIIWIEARPPSPDDIQRGKRGQVRIMREAPDDAPRKNGTPSQTLFKRGRPPKHMTVKVGNQRAVITKGDTIRFTKINGRILDNGIMLRRSGHRIVEMRERQIMKGPRNKRKH